MKRLFAIIFFVVTCTLTYCQHCHLCGGYIYSLKVVNTQNKPINGLNIYLLDSNFQKVPFLRTVVTGWSDAIDGETFYDVEDTVQFWENPINKNIPCDTSKVTTSCIYFPFLKDCYLVVPNPWYGPEEYDWTKYFIGIYYYNEVLKKNQDTIVKLDTTRIMFTCTAMPLWHDSVFVQEKTHVVTLSENVIKIDSSKIILSYLENNIVLRSNYYCNWFTYKNTDYEVFIDKITGDTLETRLLLNKKKRIHNITHYKDNAPEYRITYIVELSECEKKLQKNRKKEKFWRFFGVRKISFFPTCYFKFGDIKVKNYEKFENGIWKKYKKQNFSYEMYNGKGKFITKEVNDDFMYKEIKNEVKFD